MDRGTIHRQLMPPEEYTYNGEDSVLIGENNTSVYGVQFDSVNVGKAKYNEIYLGYEQDTFRDYSVGGLQVGNMIKVNYRERNVKTPYRIAYLKTHEIEEDEYRGPDWNRRNFQIVLEPFNNRGNTLLLSGIRRFNSEKQHTEWTTSTGDNIHSTDDLIARITSGEDTVEHMMRKTGDRLNKFHDISIVSDIDAADLLEIKDPDLVPVVI